LNLEKCPALANVPGAEIVSILDSNPDGKAGFYRATGE
jgi:hypothetical protein